MVPTVPERLTSMLRQSIRLVEQIHRPELQQGTVQRAQYIQEYTSDYARDSWSTYIPTKFEISVSFKIPIILGIPI